MNFKGLANRYGKPVKLSSQPVCHLLLFETHHTHHMVPRYTGVPSLFPTAKRVCWRQTSSNQQIRHPGTAVAPWNLRRQFRTLSHPKCPSYTLLENKEILVSPGQWASVLSSVLVVYRYYSLKNFMGTLVTPGKQQGWVLVTKHCCLFVFAAKVGGRKLFNQILIGRQEWMITGKKISLNIFID